MLAITGNSLSGAGAGIILRSSPAISIGDIEPRAASVRQEAGASRSVAHKSTVKRKWIRTDSEGLHCVSFDRRSKCGWTPQALHCPGCKSRYSHSLNRSVQCRAVPDEDPNEGADSAAAQAMELLSDAAEGELTFFDRLALAWSIFFPPSKRKSSSNAEIAKQRLKMILISDRCSVNDEAKRKIVNNIVGALSDFVEIESEDKVQLTVSSDPSLGTVYSVTVPVRRVKPEYQESSGELQNVALAEEFMDDFRTLDISLEYSDTLDTPPA